MDNLINFITEYFNPTGEKFEIMENIGEGENKRLDFWDELLAILEKSGEVDYNDYPDGMDKHDILWEVLDDQLNTSYAWQYETLDDKDEMGRLIKEKMQQVNDAYKEMYGDSDEEEPTEGSRSNKMDTVKTAGYVMDIENDIVPNWFSKNDIETFIGKDITDEQFNEFKNHLKDVTDIDDDVSDLVAEHAREYFNTKTIEADNLSIHKTAEEGYQGWTNYETWAVNLWFGGDQGLYQSIMDYIAELKEASPIEEGTEDPGVISDMQVKLEDYMKDFVEENNPVGDQATMYADLMNGAISSVNWREIAEAWIESAKE